LPIDIWKIYVSEIVSKEKGIFTLIWNLDIASFAMNAAITTISIIPLPPKDLTYF
jgi:hypothetical protein